MIKVKEGNLFDSIGLICHQVNCKGKMGRGIVKTFKQRYPLSFSNYLKECRAPAADLLGTCIFTTENIYTITVSMFAQDGYSGFGCKTNYNAFRQCCKEIVKFLNTNKSYPINMPYRIGCGLAGGDWKIVKSIIEEELGNYDITLWKYKGE